MIARGGWMLALLIALNALGTHRTKLTGDRDWPHFGNTADQTRYSSLTQINTTTVARLGLAWSRAEGPRLATFESDPVVVDGVIYYTTNTDQVIAARAATGQVLWRYTPLVDFSLLLQGGGVEQPVNRGVEVADGRVYLLTFDDHLIALDAANGRVLWNATVASPRDGYSEASPPTYWHGMLFVGSAEGDAGQRGFIAAYDARTGRQVWRFFTVPAPGHQWVPATGHHGGGDVWMPVTVDTATGVLYAGTGNPSPDLTNQGRPGCNPWSDTIVALDARTGRLRWARTLVCPDVWDYDVGQSPILLTLRLHGHPTRVVGVGTKEGRYWLLDAANGRVLATTLLLGKQTLPRPVPTAQGVIVCPGNLGSLGYSPPAYSPATGLLYLPGMNICSRYRSAPAHENAAHAVGEPDLGGTVEPAPGRRDGFLVAIDPRSGQVRWNTPMPAPLVGGVLAMVGGLVFSGCEDGYLYAFDARTGAVRWRARLGVGFGAAPITYQVGGVQYLAIAAGGSASTALTGARTGGTLVVFKLGGGPIRPVPGAANS